MGQRIYMYDLSYEAVIQLSIDRNYETELAPDNCTWAECRNVVAVLSPGHLKLIGCPGT